MDEMQLLIDFERDQEGTSPKPLQDWVHGNPVHAPALLDHAVSLKATAGVLDSPPTTEEREASRNSFLRYRDRISAAVDLACSEVATATIESLLEAAKSAGVSKKALLDRLGIDLTLLGKLERRLIRASTVPTVLVDRLSDAIGATREQVSAYLRLPPTLSLAADYKSAQAPTVGQQQDFAEALAAASLPPDSRANWEQLAVDTLGEEV